MGIKKAYPMMPPSAVQYYHMHRADVHPLIYNIHLTLCSDISQHWIVCTPWAWAEYSISLPHQMMISQVLYINCTGQTFIFTSHANPRSVCTTWA